MTSNLIHVGSLFDPELQFEIFTAYRLYGWDQLRSSIPPEVTDGILKSIIKKGGKMWNPK